MLKVVKKGRLEVFSYYLWIVGPLTIFFLVGMMKDKLIDLNLLELLTHEVTKENPEEEKLKHYMKQAGLKYSSDPIARINTVLEGIQILENKETEND